MSYFKENVNPTLDKIKHGLTNLLFNNPYIQQPLDSTIFTLNINEFNVPLI